MIKMIILNDVMYGLKEISNRIYILIVNYMTDSLNIMFSKFNSYKLVIRNMEPCNIELLMYEYKSIRIR